MSSIFIQTPVQPALLGGFWAFCKCNDLSPSVALRMVVHHVLVRDGYAVGDYNPESERRGDFKVWQRRRARAIDEEGIHPVLIARVTPGFKDAFARYASAAGVSSPVALKAIVDQVVKATRVEPSEVEVPKQPEIRSERITVRFSKEELAEIERRAQDFGSVRDWLVALARAQIAPDVPQFSPEALQILYESNRELSAIGRNVNQIAHAVNLHLQQAGGLRRSRALVDELVTLKATIAAHTERVTALCSASAARWSPR
jgi:Bacterial mobilisation protein (MobC)